MVKRVISKTPKQLYNAFRLRKRGSLWKNAFNAFRNEKMVFSEEEYDKESDIRLLVDKYDVFVCGSDMLWSEEFYADWKFYFLGFAPKEKSIAYAPSFGKNEIYDEHKPLCCELINDIGYLSCQYQGHQLHCGQAGYGAGQKDAGGAAGRPGLRPENTPTSRRP